MKKNDHTDEVRQFIRQLVREATEQPTIAPAMAAGRTVDSEGLTAFLRQEGLFGNEEDILSILEGQPTQKVMNDVSEYIAFHKIGSDPAQLSADVILEYFLRWNNMNIEKNQILAFSLKEN